MNIRKLTSYVLLVSLAVMMLWTPGVYAAVMLNGNTSRDSVFDVVPAWNSQTAGVDIELVGQIGGRSNAVFIEGSYGYLGVGSSLTVLDIANVAAPMMLSQVLLPGRMIWDIYGSNGYVYVADDNRGLRIVDAADPANPVEIGACELPGVARGVFVVGDYAYVAGDRLGLWVVDVSDPGYPVQVGFYDTPGRAWGIFVSGNYAYVADMEAGLRVMDVSNPANPFEVGLFETPARVIGVYVNGNYAYVVDRWGILHVLDASDPSNLLEVGTYSVGVGENIYVSGMYAYVVGMAGLRVVDISDPTTPTGVGEYYGTEYAVDVHVSAGHAYIVDGTGIGGLRIVEVNDPANLAEVGYYRIPVSATGIHLAGDHAYLAAGPSGLVIVDVSNPATPIVVGSYDTPGYAWDVNISGNHAYVADGWMGLRVVDITDPSNPIEVGFYDTPANAQAISISGTNAYVADGEGGLRVIDVSDLTDPTEVGVYQPSSGEEEEPPYDVRSVAVLGSYAYVLTLNEGLRVVDISDPVEPVEVGSSYCMAEDIHIAGSYAYLASQAGGLRVMDLSNPAVPIEVSFLETPGQARGIYATENYAYVADSQMGMRMVDVSNPVVPTEIGFYDGDGPQRGLVEDTFANGDYIYAVGDMGLQILHFTGTPGPMPIPPIADFYFEDSMEGAPTVFVDISEDPDGSIAQWWWDFGDGDTSTEQSPIHVFSDNGQYDVTLTVTDSAELTGSSVRTITIANESPTVGPITAPIDPVEVNTTITANADFTDPGVLDTHTADWSWGDGETSAGTVDEIDGSGSVTGGHAYTEAGVYTIILTVTDKDGDSGESIFQYVVIYDPDGGFVTGGGWIDSPEGAYAPDQTLTGKAIFGFVSKYKKGADIPTGQTEFQFKVADLNFQSTSYQWLVIAGPQAKFKGDGAINGEGEYGFMLTAIDGAINGGGGVDKFRIKIWDKATGAIVYDNQIDAPDDADPTTVLGGGSIVIHKK